MACTALRVLLLLAALSTVLGEDLKWVPVWSSHQLPDAAKDASRHWVVLVAGSNGWFNYRHQADICHAYQIVKKHGVPEDQIITMMYDDIANNPENPTKGVIINRPNGSDVYAGVKIDYKGDDVTPDNFLGVLNGTGKGKVLRSGPGDFVFINFVDHGATGLIGFPNGVLAAKPLIDALNYMHQNKMYRKLAFYLEACESGSMFDGLLPPDASIYATTASNPYESSYACYYDDKRDTYLGDVYSVNWMEDTDAKDINLESLDDQFTVTRMKTNTSHVTKYGETSLGTEKVGEFQGCLDTEPSVTTCPSTPQWADTVSQRDVPISILKKRLAKALTRQDYATMNLLVKQVLQLEWRRAIVGKVFDGIIATSVSTSRLKRLLTAVRFPLRNLDCHHRAVNEIHERCFNLGQTEEALQHIYKIVNLCESRVRTAKILAAVREVCGPHFRL